MELAKAYVQIIPSAKGIKGELESAMGGEVSSAGSSAGSLFGSNLVGTLTKVVAAAGIGATIKKALDAGGALQQSFGGLETIYGEAAEAAKGYAKEAAAAGISMNDYAEQAVSFGASLKQAFAGDTAAAVEAANTAIMDMTDNAAKMGTPIENIQNAYQGFAKQNYTMLDNLKLGYGGTKTEMERLLADAQKLSGVEYNIDNLGDVYEAIHVIQGELGLTGVAAQEASETFTGSLGAVKASWDNLLANLALGESVEEPLRAIIGNLQAFVGNNLLPMLGNILKAIPTLLAELVTQLVAALPSIIEQVVSLLGEIGQSILEFDWSGTLDSLISGIKSSIASLASTYFSGDNDVITNFAESLSNGYITIYEKGAELITKLTDGIGNKLPDIIRKGGDTLLKFAEGFLQRLPDIINSAAKMIDALVKGVGNALPKIIPAVVQVIMKFTTTILNNLPKIIEAGFNLIITLVTGIIRAIPKILAAMPKVIAAVWDAIKNVDWLELGASIIRGIINGIKALASALWDAITEIAKGAFNAVKSFFGIGSPSRLMRDEVGKWIPAGIAVGIEDNMTPLEDAMADVATEATASYNTDVAMADATAAAPTSAVNYGGVTINVTADSIQQSRDFVDWLEAQLTQRTQNRRTAALA